MSMNFFRTCKNCSLEIYLTEDDQLIQTASKVDICIQSKTSPPQTLCHYFPQSQAQGFSNVFLVVVLQIRIERKMRRLGKNAILKYKLNPLGNVSCPLGCDVNLLFRTFPPNQFQKRKCSGLCRSCEAKYL